MVLFSRPTHLTHPSLHIPPTHISTLFPRCIGSSFVHVYCGFQFGTFHSRKSYRSANFVLVRFKVVKCRTTVLCSVISGNEAFLTFNATKCWPHALYSFRLLTFFNLVISSSVRPVLSVNFVSSRQSPDRNDLYIRQTS